MNDNWYTPDPVLDAVRAWIGPIDLDPCSSDAANQRVRAGRYYTIDDNGLARPWNATTVYMNPPYSRGNIDRFVDKFLAEYAAGAPSNAPPSSRTRRRTPAPVNACLPPPIMRSSRAVASALSRRMARRPVSRHAGR